MTDDKRICYAVSSGEYFDYSVDRVFELREDADHVAQHKAERDGIA